ncbi:UDP-N-acetylmuramoyl-tripeptide--D-alanyl-D-alanine ligase [Schleiferilactobacillus shenzhenensis]|uniref:UDP-N-acetylmuramoyl-tripeptide--D-alanyl-D-alanine ligase n=1 Tax=Schleiferilactobacillus shenzhenensis LY-73 TaxID=1231336 RepID=U4TIB0_9LACO|nr:UDP-N-acetylmuramoyl-tripeptide--D-alanyl-D-alanine ligase [Schleiferilactobacillus shenzhenensis]ERL63899.1 UDP-N-acetylmuramoylalanyl-D-glutamyl-2,6-diaminopimelate--D-alanyl- D-alanine ligase [Schleiferilactobacillus shenzhenensis LY-73]
MHFKVSEIVNALHAPAVDEKFADREVTGVTFDSRQIKPGMLFVPLAGERDGHEFVPAAIAGGAAATFWAADHTENIPQDFPVIQVPDPLTAMWDLSAHYLHKINPKVVAVTGSNGKTTTKDMVATILATQYNVAKTYANYNNEIGLPYTILNAPTNTEVLVLEMGMDRPGQIAHMTKLAQPDVAVITMIGEAHIEFFGTRAKIADAKMEIVQGLSADGTFIYNGDEPLLRERAEKVPQKKRTFGDGPSNDLYPISVQPAPQQTQFVTNKWSDVTFTIPMMGEYNIFNALAAIQVARQFHVLPEKIAQALRKFVPTANRAQWLKGDDGEQILSDVYNSNPTAVKDVLHDFVQVPTTGQRIIVLGDMLELGDHAAALHAGLAQSIDPRQIQQVFLYGNEMQALAAALADKYGAAGLHYYPTGDQSQLIKDLQATIHNPDLVLLKGSHGMHLENVLAKL